jgi:hypothetical protein|tara:strand:- start:209 stop:406 length:198 start_codon:yes stop_codon:yes gene_type:complete
MTDETETTTKTITVTIEPTDNPAVFRVEGKTVAGRGQLRTALNAATKGAVASMVDELLPGKPSTE